jgi:CubicO group peptidase (beta-lactamase class C family)
MRFAETPLPPAAFTDPARRQKLASAFPAIEAYLAAEAKKDKVPGLAVGIVIDGELAFARGLGVGDTASKAPVDVDTVFRIASMTKSFTAMAILQLRDAGKLSLEDPVARYIPELGALPYPTRDSAPITVRNLLTHSAGFPEDNPWADRQVAANDDYERLVKRDGISFAPGIGIGPEYSNLGYAMLGRIIENVSGMRYDAYLKANVLLPLGMTGTVCFEPDVAKGRLARGYDLDHGAPEALVNPPDGAQDSAGCLYSSVADMARYIAFHLAAWPPRDEADTGPLRRSSVREMQVGGRPWGLSAMQGTATRPRDVEALAYGFGLFRTETCNFDLSIEHSGGLPGYTSDMQFLPEHGVGVVALANASIRTPLSVVETVVRMLLATGGLTRRTVTPTPALVAARETVDRLVARWDGAAADGAFIATAYLDKPKAELEADFAALRAAHGACHPDGPLDAENGLRGRWKLTCERGWIDLVARLAPTVPPRIELLRTTGTLPPSAALTAAADRLAALVGRWDGAEATRLFAKDVDLEPMKKLFADTATARGACHVERPVGGDGKRKAKMRLACERSPIVLDFSLAEKAEKAEKGDKGERVESAKLVSVARRDAKCAQ